MSRIQLAVCAAAIAIAALVLALWYEALPAVVPVHWDIDGEVNGYAPRSAMWLLGPGAMAMTLALAWVIPWLSPARFKVEPFRRTFNYLIVVLVFLMGYLFGVVFAAALGMAVSGRAAVWPAVFVALILLGNPMGKVRQNFFVGIRTPWTIASDIVWDATHRLAARLMVASGVLGLLALALAAPAAFYASLSVGWALIAVVYSFIRYKQFERTGS